MQGTPLQTSIDTTSQQSIGVAEDSDLDSMPELEDDTDASNIEIPLWLIPRGVMIAFRGGRMVFEREQGTRGNSSR